MLSSKNLILMALFHIFFQNLDYILICKIYNVKHLCSLYKRESKIIYIHYEYSLIEKNHYIKCIHWEWLGDIIDNHLFTNAKYIDFFHSSRINFYKQNIEMNFFNKLNNYHQFPLNIQNFSNSIHHYKICIQVIN